MIEAFLQWNQVIINKFVRLEKAKKILKFWSWSIYSKI